MPFNIRVSGRAAENGYLPYRRLALVCEGGGQRGIFTAGVLDAFLEQDYFPFQLMIGSSAGAQNLTAYVAAQRGYARTLITRFSTSKEFFSPVRFIRGGHLLDLDWLMEIARSELPLELKRAEQRLEGRQLLMCASRVDTLQAEYLPPRQRGWMPAIKASSAIPMFYRGGVELDGRRYWDGGVADAVPVRAAYEQGADLIVVIRTVPYTHREKPMRGEGRLPESGRLGEMAQVMIRHMKGYCDAEAFIDAPPPQVCVVELAPRVPLASNVLGSSQDALENDYRMGLACGRHFVDRMAHRLQRVAA